MSFVYFYYIQYPKEKETHTKHYTECMIKLNDSLTVKLVDKFVRDSWF